MNLKNGNLTDVLKNLCPKGDMPPDVVLNLRHCIGTKRLFGAQLGISAFNDLKNNNKANYANEKILVEIAILSRSYLVIDDHIKDEIVSAEADAYYRKWACNIKNKILNLLDVIGENPEQFDTFLSIAESAFVRRLDPKQCDFYRTSIEKCIIVFMPYNLEIIKNNIKNWSGRIKFLEHLFFSCQILDDFYDMKDDAEDKLVNQNIFLQGIEKEYWEGLIQNKQKLAITILNLIKKEMSRDDVKLGIINSPIFQRYLYNAKWWLDKKLAEKDEGFLLDILSKIYENWAFNINDLNQLLQFPNNVDRNFIMDMRPEFLQTAAMGVSDLCQL